jgi:cytochrome c-type biogenesis protein CcmH/NrfG
MTQEPDQAEDLARSILARAPKNTEALLVLGDVFAMRGNWRQAAVQYAAATASDSPRPEIWLRLGQALQYDGQPAMAELAFDTYRRFHVK